MAVSVFAFRTDDGRGQEERLREAAFLAGYGEKEGKQLWGTAGLNNGDFWRIARTERGKPYFPAQPKLHFSISHSGNLWVCAYSGRPVGVDVQEHVRKRGESREEASSRLSRLADRFFHPKEAGWVRENPWGRFFWIWTAKESYVKYTGSGIGADFGRFCLAPPEPHGAGKAVLENDFFSWAAQGVRFHSRKLSKTYTLCVCSEESEPVAEFRYVGKISDNNREEIE